MAQRVMGAADGNQILIGESVYNELRYREKYMSRLQSLGFVEIKHNMRIRVYQLIGDFEGLNTEHPSSIKLDQAKAPPKLTKVAAYYFAHAIRLQKFLMDKYSGPMSYTEEALLWLLAEDSVKKSNVTSEAQRLQYEQVYRIKDTLEDLYNKLDSIPFRLLGVFENFLREKVLKGFTGDYFEHIGECRFLNRKGIEKLKQEWPQIWAEFGLDEFVESTPRGIPI